MGIKSFVVISLYSQWQPHTLYEGVIAKYIKNLGWDVRQIYCDGFMPVCDVQWQRVSITREEVCRSCQKSLLRSTNYFNMVPYAFSKFYQSTGLEDSILQANTESELLQIHVDGISVFDNVRSSVVSHLRAEFVDLSDENHFQLAKLYMVSAIKVLESAISFLKSVNASSVLILGGRFAATSLLYTSLKRKGFTVLTYERTLFEDRLFLYKDRPTYMMESQSFDFEYRQPTYSKLDEIELRLWLSKRVMHTSSHQMYSKITDPPTHFNLIFDRFLQSTSASDDLKCRDLICIFTSSMDEWSEVDSYNPIMSQTEWLTRTLDYLLEPAHSKYKIIIKLHPNAISNGRYEDAHLELLEIIKRYESVKNLLVCESTETSVSPYDMLARARASITFGSTISIESLIFGVPALVMSRLSLYSPQGFVRPLNTKSLKGSIDKLLCFPWDRHHLYDIGIALLANYRRLTFDCKPVRMIGRHHAGVRPEWIDRYNDDLYNQLSVALEGQSDSPIAIKSEVFPSKRKTFFGNMFSANKPLADNQVFISVIVVNFNYARFINQCVTSVLGSLPLFKELIIIDDASTDNSVEVIEGILSRLSSDAKSSVKFIRLEQNQGQPATVRNIAASRAQGSHLLFLDADDWLNTRELKNLVGFVSQYPRSVIYYNRVDVRNDGQLIYVRSRVFDGKALIRGNYLNYSSIIPKCFFELVGGYRENVPGTEDWDLWVAFLALRLDFAWLDRPILYYRVKEDGLNARTLPLLGVRHSQILENNRILDWT